MSVYGERGNEFQYWNKSFYLFSQAVLLHLLHFLAVSRKTKESMSNKLWKPHFLKKKPKNFSGLDSLFWKFKQKQYAQHFRELNHCFRGWGIGTECQLQAVALQALAFCNKYQWVQVITAAVWHNMPEAKKMKTPVW